jgi:hypothetical protein
MSNNRTNDRRDPGVIIGTIDLQGRGILVSSFRKMLAKVITRRAPFQQMRCATPYIQQHSNDPTFSIEWVYEPLMARPLS